jgi:hypothetical protein
MRVLTVVILFFAGFLFPTWQRHWTQTADETIWHVKYTNCDKGYAVELPTGVVAHGSLPPSPNHGFLISALAPETTSEVTLDADRLVGVYATYGAAEYGSARGYLKQELEWEGPIEVVANYDTKFQGQPAAYAHFRKTKGETTLETEEVIVYRRSKSVGPIFYVLWLRSTSQSYAQDRKLYEQIRSGFRILPAPKGQCSNE